MNKKMFLNKKTNTIVEINNIVDDYAIDNYGNKIHLSELFNSDIYVSYNLTDDNKNPIMNDYNDLNKMLNMSDYYNTLSKLREQILNIDVDEINITPQDDNINNSNDIVRDEPNVVNEKQNNPMDFIFKNMKRSVDFNISMTFKNKIPRIDFIKMMEDSYSISIIDYLVNEMAEKIINDKDYIKNEIKSKLNSIVYKTKQNKRSSRKRNNRQKSTDN